MCSVYRNQGQGSVTLGVTSLDRFYNLLLMKSFRHTFLKNCKGYKVKLGTYMDSGLIYCVLCMLDSGPKAHNS